MPTPTTSVSTDPENGIRISDAAAAAGVSPRTLRYYEELGLLTPSLYTPGGERRYTESDLTQLHRILELREVLGMNLDEIKEFLSFETRLDVLRTDYRAKKDATTPAARDEQKATLQEALELIESLAEQLNAKLARMDTFRAKLTGDAQRCRDLLNELEHAPTAHRLGAAQARRRAWSLPCLSRGHAQGNRSGGCPDGGRAKTAKFDGSCTALGRKRKSERAQPCLPAPHDSPSWPHSSQPAPRSPWHIRPRRGPIRSVV